jgi:hypothetical protein
MKKKYGEYLLKPDDRLVEFSINNSVYDDQPREKFANSTAKL